MTASATLNLCSEGTAVAVHAMNQGLAVGQGLLNTGTPLVAEVLRNKSVHMWGTHTAKDAVAERRMDEAGAGQTRQQSNPVGQPAQV